jgi:hypothetical protein
MSSSKVNRFIKNNFAHFKEIYKNEKEMSQYWQKFQDTGKQEIALLDFVGLHEFYKTMKATNNSLIKLIMIISLIEKLSSSREYVDFAEWLEEHEQATENKRCESIQKHCKKLWNEYNKECGCSSKFRRFFNNSEFITKDEQIALLRSVSIFEKDRPYFRVHPFCFDKNCPITNIERITSVSIMTGNPRSDCGDCPLFEDHKKLKKAMGEYALFLYEVRNRFVHNASLAPFPSGKSSLFGSEEKMVSITRYRFRRDRKRAVILRVFITSGTDQLEIILDRNFKKMLKSYIEKARVAPKA